MMGSIVLDAFVTFTVAFPSDEAVKENQISIAVDEVNPPQASPAWLCVAPTEETLNGVGVKAIAFTHSSFGGSVKKATTLLLAL